VIGNPFLNLGANCPGPFFTLERLTFRHDECADIVFRDSARLGVIFCQPLRSATAAHRQDSDFLGLQRSPAGAGHIGNDHKPHQGHQQVSFRYQDIAPFMKNKTVLHIILNRVPGKGSGTSFRLARPSVWRASRPKIVPDPALLLASRKSLLATRSTLALLVACSNAILT